MREWLRNLRREKNLTMKDIGNKIGVSESYYCTIENGTRMKNLDISVASSLSIALDVPISFIIESELLCMNSRPDSSSEEVT